PDHAGPGGRAGPLDSGRGHDARLEGRCPGRGPVADGAPGGPDRGYGRVGAAHHRPDRCGRGLLANPPGGPREPAHAGGHPRHGTPRAAKPRRQPAGYFMTPREQERFDALVEEAIEQLPPGVRRLLDEMPVIVEDKPTAKLIEELKAEGVTPTSADTEEERE